MGVALKQLGKEADSVDCRLEVLVVAAVVVYSAAVVAENLQREKPFG